MAKSQDRKIVINNKAPTPSMRPNSALQQRYALAGYLGIQFDGKRDLYNVFGYKKNLKFEDYLAKYTRQNVAKRIVNAPADATWRNTPEISFTDDVNISTQKKFKKQWDKLVRKQKLYAVLNKADRLAGLGNYSIILLGFDDGADLSTPAKASNLLYLQPYSQYFVEIASIDSDESSPRFGLPLMYTIKVQDPLKSIATGLDMSNSKNPITATKILNVHYSRVVHVAEDTTDNAIVGTPRLEDVYNLLDDLEKLVGGTSETFWLTANKGMQVNIDNDVEMTPDDEQALSDEIDEYQNQLRRVIRTRGVKINDLGSEVPDPKNNFDVIMALISGTKGIPRRILLGSEIGQLASDQDRANWADRIKERRNNFAEPCVLIPLIEKLILAGVLPTIDVSDIEFTWPTNFQLTPLEEAQSQAQKARALANLGKTFVDNPMVTKGEARTIVGLPYEPPEPLPEPSATNDSAGSSGAQEPTDPEDDTVDENPANPPAKTDE